MKTAYQARAAKAISHYLVAGGMIGLTAAVGVSVSSAILVAVWAPLTELVGKLF